MSAFVGAPYRPVNTVCRCMRASMDRNPAAERWILMQCRPGMAHACGAADASVLLLRAELRASHDREVDPISHRPGPPREAIPQPIGQGEHPLPDRYARQDRLVAAVLYAVTAMSAGLARQRAIRMTLTGITRSGS